MRCKRLSETYYNVYCMLQLSLFVSVNCVLQSVLVFKALVFSIAFVLLDLTKIKSVLDKLCVFCL